MEVQNDLGADIIMAFDECPDPNRPVEYQQIAVERTLRWARVCQESHARPGDQALFGIVQGGTDPRLRTYCAQELISMDFPGYAIGGLAVGEGFDAMVRVLGLVGPMLPPHRPRYLMGVGFPRDIVSAVAAGMDMFDCVMPTRNGRNAYAFTAQGPLRLRNSALSADIGPLEAGCDCYTCRNYTRGAIRHYFLASEMLGPILVSLHNIRFYQRLMTDIRRAIGQGSFEQFARTDPRCRLGPAGATADDALSDQDS
jgi:queuine tRNA-ribosyltransferase